MEIANLYRLNQSPCQFGELKINLYPITKQMLTKQPRELEKDGLISRQVFNVIPPKVEYSLTQFDLSLKPDIALCANGYLKIRSIFNKAQITPTQLFRAV